MAEGDLEEDVRQALAQVVHPEVDLSLADLGDDQRRKCQV